MIEMKTISEKIIAQEKKKERKKKKNTHTEESSLGQGSENKTEGDKYIIIRINFENAKASVWPIIIQEILPKCFVSYICC